MRPSDIRPTRKINSSNQQQQQHHCQEADISSAEVVGRDDEHEHEQDVVLSQAAVSQQSVLLWDEFRILVSALTSSNPVVASKAEVCIVELGLDNLDDSVLNRLCSNEIFKSGNTENLDMDDVEIGGNEEPDTDEPMSLGLPYQASLHLYRTLFLRKSRELQAAPSRLFLDSILCASQSHGRAMVDSVLQPLVSDYSKFSKFMSELVLKSLKEQSPA
ncbi:hypothetical protein BG004_003282, partial [Podila humilis]